MKIEHAEKEMKADDKPYVMEVGLWNVRRDHCIQANSCETLFGHCPAVAG